MFNKHYIIGMEGFCNSLLPHVFHFEKTANVVYVAWPEELRHKCLSILETFVAI